MFNKTKSTLAATLSVAMLASMITIPASAATATQISGKDRYETALKIVEAGWTKSDSAVIARGDDLADALAAAPLAFAKGKAPILLTKTNEIPTGVLAELKALGVKNVYIVGGVGAVSKAVADEMAAAGLTITRVSGNDRFETSLKIAKEAFTTTPAEVIIANGLAYADALSVSSIAAAKGMPILLVNNSKLSADQAAYIAGKTVYAVGGEGVLNTDVVSVAKAERISGLDRYKTNAAVLAKFKPDYSKIYLAKGTPANLVDALAGSALAALTNSPIVLVDQANKINAEQTTTVKASITGSSALVTLGGTVTQAAADAVEALKSGVVTVKSVSAVSAKALKVTFSGAVDTTKAVFGVTRGAAGTIAVTGYTVTWNTDKTEATLTQETKYAADTYKVAVTGLGTVLEGTVAVVAQAVSKIEIVSTDLIKGVVSTVADATLGNSTDATFTYKVLDQYGTDITSTIAVSDINATVVVGSSLVTPVLTASKGIGKIAHNFTTAEAAKTAVVTLVYAKTGVVSTKTLNVVAAASITNLTFGETAVYPTGKTKIEVGQAAAVTLPVTAVDQYGNTIKDYTQLNASLNVVTSSTNAIASFSEDVDGKPVLVLDTTGMTDKTTVVVTFVNRTTGVSWTKNFDVQKAIVADKLVVNDFATSTIANGDDKVGLAIDVYDQFGTLLTKAQIASNKAVIDLWISGAGKLGGLTVDADANSKTYGMLKTGVVSSTATGTTNDTVVVLFNAPGGVVTKTITVVPARIVTTVSKVANSNLLQGAKKTLLFVYKDQFDQVLSNDDMKATTPLFENPMLTYNITVTRASGDIGGLDLTLPIGGKTIDPVTGEIKVTGLTENQLAEIKVQSASTKTGSYKVTVDLLTTPTGTAVTATSGTVTSSASTVVNVVKNNVAGLVYNVADVPTLNGATPQNTNFISAGGINTVDSTTPINTASVYAQKIAVTAVDASGTAYVINKNDIVSVVSSNPAVVDVAKNVAPGTGDWYAASAATWLPTDAPTKTATLTVTINTLDGVKAVTKTITVAKEAVKIQQLRVVDMSISTENETAPLANDGISSETDVSGLTDKLTYAFDKKDDAVVGSPIHVIGLDQYGVWTDQATTGAFVNSTDIAPVNAFTVTSTGVGPLLVSSLKLANRVGTTSAKDLKVTLTKDSGSVQIIVNIAKADLLTVVPTATPNASFTATVQNYAGFALNAATMTDMDISTTAIDSSIVINGLTYTVSGGVTGTVAVTGTGTAAATATVKTIKVIDSATGASDTIKLNISAVTLGGASTVTISN